MSFPTSTRAWVGLACLLGGLMFCTAAGADDPLVQNVQVQQRMDGSRIIDVSYDVEDADGGPLAISLQLSVTDGATWDFPVLNASGDIGNGIEPGTGKSIQLDFSQVPGAVVYEQFRAKVVASDEGVLFPAHSPSNVAVLQLGVVDWSIRANIEKFSRADLVVVTANDIWWGSPFEDTPVVTDIKELNPDQKIVGYVHGFAAKLVDAGADPRHFWYQWHHRTLPYWSWTTEGDTAQSWPGSVVINILDPDCRQVMINTIVEYHNLSLNKLDGVYWDYWGNALWISPFVDVQGEIDLDGDGIGHDSDLQEREDYRAAQVELITALRDTLGESFLQIFNGQRAYGDEAFANLADGVMYEIFPTLHFPDPDMQTALDPNFVHNLFNARQWLRSQNGGPYLMMSNPWQSWYTDTEGVFTMILTGNQYRAVAMVMDGYASWNAHDGDTFSYTYGWTDNDISVGQPLGPAVIDGSFIRRDFQYGRIEIEMTTGEYPNPFDYRIWALGQLVEELNIPYHFP